MATTETEPGPLADLTAFQRDVLTVVARLDGDEKPHGLAIKHRLEDDLGKREVNHGRLYPNLDTLVDKGLIEKGSKDRRTNSYTLTDRGQRELRSDLNWREGVLADGQ